MINLNLQEDLNEISKMVWKYLDDKYIEALREEIKECQKVCNANLGKEALLIQSLIPFMPQEKQVFDMMIQVIQYNNVIDVLIGKYPQLKTLYKDENPEFERFKRLAFKMVVMKLMTMLEKKETA